VTWERKPIGELLQQLPNKKVVQQGWSPKCHTHPAAQDNWGVLKTTAIQAGRFLPQHNKELPEGLEPRPNIEVEVGDLLLTCAGPRARCGVPALVRATPGRLMMSGKMYRLRPDERLDSRFLELFLLSDEAQKRIDEMKTGISDSGLNLTHGRFIRLQVPVPPLDEQRRIVAILEDHLSRLEAATTGLGLTAHRLASLELSLAAQATFGAASNRVTLAEISTLITDGDHNPPKRVASGVPHVTAKGITPDGLISLDAGTYVSEDGFLQTAKRYLPTPGDVIVTCVGTIGRVAVVPPGVRFSADRNLAAVRLNHEIARPEYVEIALKSARIQRFMQSASSSTAQPHLYLRDLRRVEISVPSLTDQDQAVLWFKEAQEGFQRLRDAVALAQRRSAALRRSLLAAAFSGRLTGSSTEMSEVSGTITA